MEFNDPQISRASSTETIKFVFFFCPPIFFLFSKDHEALQCVEKYSCTKAESLEGIEKPSG